MAGVRSRVKLLGEGGEETRAHSPNSLGGASTFCNCGQGREEVSCPTQASADEVRGLAGAHEPQLVSGGPGP